MKIDSEFFNVLLSKGIRVLFTNNGIIPLPSSHFSTFWDAVRGQRPLGPETPLQAYRFKSSRYWALPGMHSSSRSLTNWSSNCTLDVRLGMSSLASSS